MGQWYQRRGTWGSLKYLSRDTQTVTMQNEAGEYVDMYIPRKCSASNRIIAAKDHASIQIFVLRHQQHEHLQNYNRALHTSQHIVLYLVSIWGYLCIHWYEWYNHQYPKLGCRQSMIG